MKQLESLGLVQYFLYEREDLQLGGNTAFLGPNGTGKTALLDAFQIVLLAADSNRTHFNASGESKKRARSLREYCLGVYGQSDAERCRPSANTYINLVFRDPETGVPVTAGVSLSASVGDPDHTFNSLYILPGVALATRDHMDPEADRETILPWRKFQHVAKDACTLVGTTPVFTQNREDFLRQLFVGHLASPGERPNTRAIRSAFARSLKLNKDVDDLNETLRQHLIEQRLTNVKAFRTRLEQFREVREMIRRLIDRIERAGVVVDKYVQVKRERTIHTNLDALRAAYETERIGEALSEQQEKAAEVARQLEKAGLDLKRATTEKRQAQEARDRAFELRSIDPEYLKQAGETERLKDKEKQHAEKHRELGNLLKLALEAAVSAGKLSVMADHQGDFEDVVHQLLDLQQHAEALAVPEPVAIQSAMLAMAHVRGLVNKALSHADREVEKARDAWRDARSAWERNRRGLTTLRPPVIALQRLLADAGIDAQPVCDRVRIADPQWQPALEAYLGIHVDALLVPEARELDAIRIYKEHKEARTIFRVKLALPSRGRAWVARGGGKFAAQLIEGEDKAAVRYLQGELGQLSLATSAEQLQTGVKALSVEGMVSSGGGVERLRPPARNEWLIGRSDTDAHRHGAQLALDDAKAALDSATAQVAHVTPVEQRLSLFADAGTTSPRLDALFTAAAEGNRELQDLRNALLATQSGQLASLNENFELAGKRLSDADAGEKRLIELKSTLESELRNSQDRIKGLTEQQDLAVLDETKTRQQPLYNANEVQRHRERYDERHGDRWNELLAALQSAIRNAETAAENHDREAWEKFSFYIRDFQLQNTDIASSQWERAYGFILNDRQRLEDMELAEQEARSKEAYEAAVKVFRTDVAQTLLEGFDAIKEQIDGLNDVLKHAPEFSNGERYHFKHTPVEQHRALYDFLKRVREHGNAEEDIFGGAGKVPDDFKALVEGDASSELLNETSPLNDHRRFFSYDVEILTGSTSIGLLSKRLGPGSGGEHRTPLYVIFGAALAAAYGKSRSAKTSGGIMLLDEAFEKMDAQNVRATADYLNALGLQLVMAGPEADQAKMSSFLNIYYDMARYGSRTVQLTRNVVLDEARELLQSDNYLLHPELLDMAMKDMAETEHDPG
ncbi:SbcC/MukB-like Walker B domain-containing protein [Pseudoxanthomonas sp. JBR18]|uniref:SbcC/MukB-like Walker B domain-containing protein n=1 Tax=Pseudoxanthomonas sp. JBR18 TaxID=2969308 RepID=UPI002304F173|nr:SbcC/MukB-like Walker B domain-containing protein [Pseudoxanthomonas sp. JBR18]WCE03841.1 SbcC/MukB-like Walker B domain-containing protein [Pseudoxanthomonas sp. JBR18]